MIRRQGSRQESRVWGWAWAARSGILQGEKGAMDERSSGAQGKQLPGGCVLRAEGNQWQEAVPLVPGTNVGSLATLGICDLTSRRTHGANTRVGHGKKEAGGLRGLLQLSYVLGKACNARVGGVGGLLSSRGVLEGTLGSFGDSLSHLCTCFGIACDCPDQRFQPVGVALADGCSRGDCKLKLSQVTRGGLKSCRVGREEIYVGLDEAPGCLGAVSEVLEAKLIACVVVSNVHVLVGCHRKEQVVEKRLQLRIAGGTSLQDGRRKKRTEDGEQRTHGCGRCEQEGKCVAAMVGSCNGWIVHGRDVDGRANGGRANGGRAKASCTSCALQC